MKVVCTTTIRNTGKGKIHGHIIEIDWKKQAIVRRINMPRPKGERLILKLNLRGLGGRGVCITKNAIYVANSNTIIKYDHNWNELGRISHQLLADIHEIEVTRDGIWVSSTGIDSAIKLDFSGQLLKIWSPRTDSLVKKVLGIEDKCRASWPPKSVGWGFNLYHPLNLILHRLEARIGLRERSPYSTIPWHLLGAKPETKTEKWLWRLHRVIPALRPNAFHLNCVYLHGEEVYVTLFTWPWLEKACVVRIEPTVDSIFGTSGLGMPHNGQVLDDEHLILNDSISQTVRVYKIKTKELVKSISCEQMGIRGEAWLRGLKQLGDSRVLIGVGAWTRPTSTSQGGQVAHSQIVELDLKRETVLNRVIISEDSLTSVHGLDAFH